MNLGSCVLHGQRNTAKGLLTYTDTYVTHAYTGHGKDPRPVVLIRTLSTKIRHKLNITFS